ncbi:hypothetical protein [Flavobacterium sp.]
MKKIILFLTILSFASCEKVEDDSAEACTSDCTSIVGKVYTHSDIPLKNVKLKFKFQKPDPAQPNLTLTRIISREQSNASGEYNMDFYLKDEEVLGEFGYFSLYPEKGSIPGNVFYPEYFDLFATIYQIPNRNVSLRKDLYIPTVKKIKIKLNNFEGILQDDYFSVTSLVPCGFDKAEIDPATGNKHNYALFGLNKFSLNKYNNNFPSKMFDVSFALNELNYIKLGRMKNGIYTEEIIAINVDANTNQIYEYSY